MAAHPDADRSLHYLRDLSGRLGDDLRRLPPETWDRPTNCPPWLVRRLVAHIVQNAEFIQLCVERGVAGSSEAPLGEDQRTRLVEALADAPAAEVIARLELATADLEALYERLSADELQAICYHRRGSRPALWYVHHRLVEVAFHYCDFQRSVGHEAVLDEHVAAFLLPTILESNLPRTYLSGPRGEGRFRLVSDGEPSLSWLLEASRERLEVRPGGNGADVTISARPSILALLAYGRADLGEEKRQGRARVEGDAVLAARFQAIFPGP